MSECLLSITAKSDSGAALPGAVLTFLRQPASVIGVGGAVRPADRRTVTCDGAGLASISLLRGQRYVLQMLTADGLRSAEFVVPDAATADLATDALGAVSAEVFSTIQAAVLAATGIRTFATTGAGIAATAVDGFFMTPASPSGFSIWQNVAGVATLRGSLLAFSNVPQAGVADTTAGRLLTVGAFGLGEPGNAGTALTTAGAADALRGWRIDRTSTALAATVGAPPGAAGGIFMTIGYAAVNQHQLYFEVTGLGRVWSRNFSSSSWSAWRQIYQPQSILGTVSQSGGTPTGAVIERGSNANGEYVRFADGTQICTRTNLSAANANTALGSLFRSADVPWTFPASFAAAPAVRGDVDDADSWMSTSGAPSTSAVNLRALAAVTKGSALTIRATAIGRWF